MDANIVPNVVAAVNDIPNRSLDFTAASNQSLQLSTANFGAYNKAKWAFSCWAQRKSDLSTDAIFSIGNSSGVGEAIFVKFDFWRQIAVTTDNVTTAGQLVTPTEFSAGSGYEAGNWYHIYVTFDASLTAADRLQLIVDGTRITSFATQTNPDGNIKTITGLVRLGRQAEDSYAADAYIYQPAFFSGVIPNVSSLRSGSSPVDLRGMSGLWSLLHTTASSTLEDDEVISTNWTNNNTVIKSSTVPA